MQEHDVGKTLTPLFQRCQKLRQGGKKYVVALSDFAAQQREFGDCLEEFGQEMMGLTDECGKFPVPDSSGCLLSRSYTLRHTQPAIVATLARN